MSESSQAEIEGKMPPKDVAECSNCLGSTESRAACRGGWKTRLQRGRAGGGMRGAAPSLGDQSHGPGVQAKLGGGAPRGRDVSAGLEGEVGRLGTEQKGQYRATRRGTRRSGSPEECN